MTTSTSTTTTTTTNRPLRILLVEDHEDTQVFMARLLRTFQYEVKAAGTVQDALALAGSNAFDLVISDLRLPDGDGYGLMQQLHERHGLRGIALSGYDQELAGRSDVGFLAHIVKPVDFDRLRAVLGQVQAS